MRERRIHQLFEVGVVFKGIDGVLEAVGGIILLFISPDRIKGVIASLTQHELSEDPRDFIASHLARYARDLSASTKLFEALYLLSHGLIKVFLVWGLLSNKLWAYPASIAFLIAFIGYQLYRYSYTHAIGLILLTVFDVFIIALTWHEYRYVLKHKSFPSA